MKNKQTKILDEKDRKILMKRMKEVLPALREMAGISQSELGKAIGVSRQTINSYENKEGLTWRSFLALEFFFFFHPLTSKFIYGDLLLRPDGVFPMAGGDNEKN